MATQQRSWSEDLGGLIRTAGKQSGKAAKAVSGALVNEQAWKNTGAALLDGPGGRKVRGRDLADMALDASILIPVAGLAGTGARIGGRLAAKSLLRGGGTRVLGREATTAGARRAGTTGATSHRASAAEGYKTKASNLLQSSKVGVNQSKKRILANAGLAGGANLLASAYDSGWNGFGDSDSTAVVDGKKDTGAGLGVLNISGAGGGYFLVGADGTQTPVSDSAGKALGAAYQNMGGSPDGSQVIYLGR